MYLTIPRMATQEEFEEILRQYPNVTDLWCKGCTFLTSIPQLDKLRELYCEGCTNLTSIPQLDKLKNLWCKGCTFLRRIWGAFYWIGFERDIRKFLR